MQAFIPALFEITAAVSSSKLNKQINKILKGKQERGWDEEREKGKGGCLYSAVPPRAEAYDDIHFSAVIGIHFNQHLALSQRAKSVELLPVYS